MRWGHNARVAAMAGIALAVSGCSWRLETPPEPVRTPSPTVALRDAVAAAEAAVVTAADADPSGALAGAEAADAPVRLAALGGVAPVWTPVPSPTGSSRSPAPVPDLRQSVGASRDTALSCALATDDAALGALCSSIALSHAATLFAADLVGDGAVASDVAERALVTANPSLIPPAGTSVRLDQLSRLALEHDRARYLYEVAAARESGDRRDRALARAGLHRARAEALLAVTGTTDLRQPTYAVDASEVRLADNRDATERAVETAIASHYAALLATAPRADRAWLLNAAYDAYTAAAALPGAIAADIPALPGLAATAG